LANRRLDGNRRRSRTRPSATGAPKHDPLYRSRRVLTRADEHLDERGRTILLGLLDAGDP
jgi:hypothetical protein